MYLTTVKTVSSSEASAYKICAIEEHIYLVHSDVREPKKKGSHFCIPVVHTYAYGRCSLVVELLGFDLTINFTQTRLNHMGMG